MTKTRRRSRASRQRKRVARIEKYPWKAYISHVNHLVWLGHYEVHCSVCRAFIAPKSKQHAQDFTRQHDRKCMP